MKVNTTYECENCHKVFNTKEEAWVHERESECELCEKIFVKEIYADPNYYEIGAFIIRCYPNAKHKKTNNTIQLYPNDKFRPYSKFCFDMIQIEYAEDGLGNDIPVIFTMNNNPEYERELINKLIDYKISDLKDKKEEIDKEINNWERARVIQKISRNEDTSYVNTKILGY